MARTARQLAARRRGRRFRYLGMLLLVMAVVGGWSWFWFYAAGKAQVTVDAWRAREAKAGRVFACGTQTIGGYPFRIEVECDKASALFRTLQPQAELKTAHILAAIQVYDPTLMISEFTGPLTIATPGHAPDFIANWKLMQSSVRGTPEAPQRVSIVADHPRIDNVGGGARHNVLSARRIELHGRMVEGSAASHPVIELVLRLGAASAPGLSPVAAQPVDADVDAVLHGLKDFSPKPWAARFRQLQAAGGRIDITRARVQQGQTIAVGGGTLELNSRGRLEGQLRVTVANVQAFLNEIGAARQLQNSQPMDKLAGALNQVAPGLGDVARAGAGANLSFGLDLLGEHTMLEGQRALTLPLRFSDGTIFLGPIAIGNVPALF